MDMMLVRYEHPRCGVHCRMTFAVSLTSKSVTGVSCSVRVALGKGHKAKLINLIMYRVKFVQEHIGLSKGTYLRFS